MYESPASIHVSFITGRTEDGRIGSIARRVTTEDSLCFLLNGDFSEGSRNANPDKAIADLIKANLSDLKKIVTKAAKSGDLHRAKDNSFSIRLTALTADSRYIDGASFWCSPYSDEGDGYFCAALNVSGDVHSKEALKVAKIPGLKQWLDLAKTVIGSQIFRCFEAGSVDPIKSPSADVFDWIRHSSPDAL